MELWHGRVGSEVYAVHNGKQVVRNYTPGKGNIEAIRRWQREHLLALVNLDDKPIVVSIKKMTPEAPTLALQYSRNGIHWQTWGYTKEVPISINIDRGARVFIRGIKNTETCLHTDVNEVITDHNQFSATGLYGLEGSVLNLLDPKWSASKQLQSHAFAGLFYNDTHIVTPPSLPSIYLARDCYRYMFGGCTALKSAPVLPAKALEPYCYSNMFFRCTALKETPYFKFNTAGVGACDSMFAYSGVEIVHDLPMASIADRSYQSMFSNCHSLKTAPKINSMSIGQYSYQYMFLGCTSLEYVPPLYVPNAFRVCSGMFEDCVNLQESPILTNKNIDKGVYYQMFYGCNSIKKVTCLAETINNATLEWLNNVSQNGTFIMSQAAYDNNIWPNGTSGVPDGWTKEVYQV